MTARRVILCAILTSLLLAIGCSSSDDEIYGTWGASSMTLNAGATTVTNVLITLTEGGIYTLTFTGGGANVESGTFTPIELSENTVVTFTVATRSGPLTIGVGGHWLAMYTDLGSSTMQFYMDRAGVGIEGPYVMTRQ